MINEYYEIGKIIIDAQDILDILWEMSIRYN